MKKEPSVFLDMVKQTPLVLDSEANDGKTKLRFKGTQSNVINTNHRLYPDAVLDSAIEKSNSLVTDNRMVGESPHPKYGVNPKTGGIVFDTSIDNSVIKWYNQFKDQDGTVYIDGEILDTAKGRDLKALVDAGVPVGVSMRATGDNVRKQINGVMVDVSTRLDISSWDIVMNPATPGCEVVQVLTDSQVIEVMKEEKPGAAVTDDVTITAANCPTCGNEMTPMDPDNDGDLDFYDCPTCKEVYIPDESKTVSIYASQSLRKLSNDPDYDGYWLAKEYQKNRATAAATTVATDSTQTKEVEEMDPKEMMKALLDSEEFKNFIAAKAQEVAKPALDAVEIQKQAEEKAKAKEETKVFVDSKMAELKDKLPETAITAIMDSVKSIEGKEAAGAVIDAAVILYSNQIATAKLDGVGFNPSSAEAAAGVVHVQVTNEPKPWNTHVQSFLDSLDRVAEEQGHKFDPSIRKVNKPIIDKLITHMEKKVGNKAFTDSVAFLDSEIVNTDSVSVTTSQLLNQPTIQQAILIQAFQDVESLQFLATEAFEGSEVRWPVETFTSAATINPATGVPDLFVGESAGIPESSVNLSWLTFNPQWRRNAISMTTDVIQVLRSGPAKYDAVSRSIYHIGFDKRRKLDTAAYLEMIMSADEYNPTVVTNETIPANQITTGASGTNVAYKANATVNGTATATAGTNPIVRQRTKTQIGATGQTSTVTTNPLTVKVNGSALTQGYLDASGNVQGGTFAVDYENGIFYFTSGAGLAPTATTPVLPVASYSAVTNYDRWSSVIPNGVDADKYYNTLLQLITTQVAKMGSAPRFQRPNLGIMSLNVAAFVENASMWYKFNNPDIGKLSGLADSTYFGDRSGVSLARINAPWAAGDGRILLTQKGATRYGIETGYGIKGPYPKYDANQQIVDAQLYYGSENSVLATPQVTDTNFNIINPKLRSIKITY